jgi:hypothetical protein
MAQGWRQEEETMTASSEPVRGSTRVTNEDLRQIILDALDPINVKMDNMAADVDEIKRTSVSRLEYDPAIKQLQIELRRVRRSIVGMRRRQENLWRNVIITIATVGGAILVLFQLAGHISIR